jgi:hypothetical protein
MISSRRKSHRFFSFFSFQKIYTQTCAALNFLDCFFFPSCMLLCLFVSFVCFTCRRRELLFLFVCVCFGVPLDVDDFVMSKVKNRKRFLCRTDVSELNESRYVQGRSVPPSTNEKTRKILSTDNYIRRRISTTTTTTRVNYDEDDDR